MGAILPFRIPQRGDWSPGERARLDELAARFADEAGVDVAYGLTDSGDPWCVVLDSNDEVLVHVAREGGSFVAHTADDLFVRSSDLATAVERVLGARWNEERADVVVPFAAAGRASAQVVTAVLVVASFVYHHQAEAQTTDDDWNFPGARLGKPDEARELRDAAKPVTAADLLPTKDFHATVTAAGLDDSDLMLPLLMDAGVTADAPSRAVPEPALSPGQHVAQLVIDATATQPGGDRAPDAVVGTDGADRLERDGSSDSPHILLDGGAGDDRLTLDPGTVAMGGEGNDIFELRAPENASAGTLLGIIVDYDPRYDVIVSSQPGNTAIVILDQIALPNIFDDPNFSLGSLSASSALPVLPGQRLTIDLNGDGIPDGYLLLNNIVAEPAAMNDVREAFGLRGGPTMNHPGSSNADNAVYNVAPVSPAVFESHVAPSPDAGPEPTAILPALPEVI